VHVRIDDRRHFVETTSEKFDADHRPIRSTRG
jgi:hypothetical protein